MPSNIARQRRGGREAPPRVKPAVAAPIVAPPAAPAPSYLASMDGSCWTPSTSAVIKLIMSVRICSALWSNISDCDETYNYWEPLHMLLRGRGKQTWEYSPVYGLRSYAYIWLHGLPALLYQRLAPDVAPVALFYQVRCCIAALTTMSEVFLYRSLEGYLSKNVARYWFAFTLGSAGMYVAAAAFLPSSFSMCLNMLAMGLWLRGVYFPAVFLTALSALLGWPFAALLGLPIALDMVFCRREFWTFVSHAALSGLCIGLVMVKLDGYYYGVGTLAPLNIILYNVFSSKGSTLYGEEPLSYYLLNLLLNQNIAFPLALLSPIFTLFAYVRIFKPPANSFWNAWGPYKKVFLLQFSFLAWLAVFFGQRHKEERFMFPSYPLIAICAALTLDSIEKIMSVVVPPGKSYVSNAIHAVISRIQGRTMCEMLSIAYGVLFLTYFTCGLSRSYALHKNYHGVMDSYMGLTEILRNETRTTEKFGTKDLRVCVGKEWYRFPSSFFFPYSTVKLDFVKSEFSGLLPKEYPALPLPQKTREIPTELNDENIEVHSLYAKLDACDYFIDFSTSDFATPSKWEPDYAKDPKWEILTKYPFLVKENSDAFFRAFYVPFLSDQNLVFGDYVVLKRRKQEAV